MQLKKKNIRLDAEQKKKWSAITAFVKVLPVLTFKVVIIYFMCGRTARLKREQEKEDRMCFSSFVKAVETRIRVAQ